jgi:hypothetical protein
MTKKDKKSLLSFISFTGMYISTPDKNNVVSFITGYEIGAKNCNFSNLFKDFITNKFKIKSVTTGWPGQIDLLSKKLSQNWLITFKQTSLQFITDSKPNELKEEFDKTIKKRIHSLIKRIHTEGDLWFNDLWREEWQSLCALDLEWFKQLWSSEELKAIQAIDKTISSNKIFADKKHTLPTKKLIDLKKRFDAL